jgi:integrase
MAAMASIWLKRGSWYLRRKRRVGEVARPAPECLGAITEAEARALLERVNTEERGIRARRAAPSSASFASVLDEWERDIKARRPRTWETYYRLHLKHIRRLFPVNRRIGEILPGDVAEYVAARLAESGRECDDGVRRRVSTRTTDKERNTLATVFNWAVERWYIDRSPAKAVKAYRDEPAERGRCSEALYREVTRELRSEGKKQPRSDSRWMHELAADVIEVFWWTGWRLGEGTRLLVADVNTRDWTIPIRSAKNKGAAKCWPLPKEVRAIFRRRIKGKKADAHIFGLENGSNAYSALAQFRRRWIASRESHRAAFFHSLRHAYTSDLTETPGVDALTAKRLTRHQTLAMLDHYTHREMIALRAAQERLSRSRGRGKRARRARP